MEFVRPGVGETTLPFRETFVRDSEYDDFTQVWFLHRSASANYLFLAAADHCHQAYGSTRDATNDSYVCMSELDAIEPDPAKRPIDYADTAAHEFGHQFGLNIGTVDSNHPPVLSHVGTDKCIMDGSRDRSAAVSEFCLDGPNHLKEVRDASDPR